MLTEFGYTLNDEPLTADTETVLVLPDGDRDAFDGHDDDTYERDA